MSDKCKFEVHGNTTKYFFCATHQTSDCPGVLSHVEFKEAINNERTR
jgi:hypothetical protein